MTVPVPSTTSPPGYHVPAAKLVGFLKSVGYGHIPCDDVTGGPVGECTGCPQVTEHHVAFCHVNVAVRKDPDDPESVLEGFSDALCFVGLAPYLRIVEATTDGIDGFHIEIPPGSAR